MRFLRKIGVLDYVSGSRDSIQIPKNDPLRAIHIRVDATFDVSSNGSALVDGQPYTLLDNIQLVANGGRNLCKVSGKRLAKINKIKNSVANQASVAPGFAATDYGSGGEPLAFSLTIDLADKKLRRAIETMLETRALSTLDLEVDFGTVTSIVTGGTSALTGVVITVFGEYETNVPLTASGDKAGTDSLILGTRAYSEVSRQISATSSAFQIDLNARNNFGRFYIFTESDGVLVDTILNGLTLQSGQKVHFQLNRTQLEGLNASEFAISTRDAGVYVIEFLNDGLISQALPAGREQSLELVLDVTKVGTEDFVHVVADEIFLPALR